MCLILIIDNTPNKITSSYKVKVRKIKDVHLLLCSLGEKIDNTTLQNEVENLNKFLFTLLPLYCFTASLGQGFVILIYRD